MSISSGQASVISFRPTIAAAGAPAPTPPAQPVAPQGTSPPPSPAAQRARGDLRLPQDLVARLENRDVVLETRTSKSVGDRVLLHRLVGPTSCLALMFFDRALDDPLRSVASLCVRICKEARDEGLTRPPTLILVADHRDAFMTAWQEARACESVGLVSGIEFEILDETSDVTILQYIKNWKTQDGAPTIDPRNLADHFVRPVPGDTARIAADSRPAPGPVAKPVVFITYAHEDVEYCNRLTKLLKPLKRAEIWCDRAIEPGDEWFKTIQRTLEEAAVVVALASADFFASDFIERHELELAIEAADSGRKKLLWVHVGRCLWQDTRIAKFQAAHDISRPLNHLIGTPELLDNQLCEIAEAIKKALPGYGDVG